MQDQEEGNRSGRAREEGDSSNVPTGPQPSYHYPIQTNPPPNLRNPIDSKPWHTHWVEERRIARGTTEREKKEGSAPESGDHEEGSKA